MRYLLLLSSSLVATAIVFACSYGNYDGSYTGTDGGDGGEGGDTGVGAVVVTRTIDPAKEEKLSTPDTGLEVTFAAGTFDGPTTITISRLEDRLLNNNLFVPTYTVAANKEPALPFEVKFIGNNTAGGDPNIALVPVHRGDDGTFRPTSMVGVFGGGGPSNAFWGLARKLGTFSLSFEQYSQDLNGFSELMPDSCLARCCTSSSGGGRNAGALGASCVCAGPPNLQCFLQSCKPNIAGAIERCVDIGSSVNQPVSCVSSPVCTPGMGRSCNYPSGPCAGGQACCLAPNAGTCLGNGGPGCPGMLVRCDLATPCPNGTQCCVLDNEAYCASTCATERRWCRTQGDCDGGAAADGGPDASPNSEGPCFLAKNCPHGTCGTPPTACTTN